MRGSTKEAALPTLTLALHSLGTPALALALCTFVLPARADILIGTNGDRFTGKVVNETADSVMFESEVAGKLTIPRSLVREIQPSPAPATDKCSINLSNTSTDSHPNPQSSTLNWLPPAVGHDTADWLQLKSGEWIRGHLYYIQKRKVEFDSDVLDDFSLNLKDVRQVYSANPLLTKFNDRDQIFGKVVVSNDVVEVFGPERVSMPRDELEGITPGGTREIDFWSGNLDIAMSLQAGNTRQANLSTSAELARRTPASTIQLNYLGNYSIVEGVQSANNHRINGLYDIRLNRHWFVRPAYLEYYRDQLANIALKGTGAVGLGYYIFDREGLEWSVAGGPGYQFTKFETVKPGESDVTSTPAGVLQSSFKADLTRRLKFIETVNLTLTSEKAGLYSHHAVSTLDFEIKRHLDLNVSFVWDYLQSPQIEASGFLPQHSDFRLNVGVGVKY